MENMDEIEQTVWEYIDGTCKDADRQIIATKIVENTLWKSKYNELKLMHLDINNMMELEQPSLRFNKNVMDAVQSTSIAPATSKYINLNVIRIIGGLFFFIILLSLYIVIAQGGFTIPSRQFHFENWTHDWFKNSYVLNTSFVYTIIGINLVLVWVLIDKIIKRNNIVTEG